MRANLLLWALWVCPASVVAIVKVAPHPYSARAKDAPTAKPGAAKEQKRRAEQIAAAMKFAWKGYTKGAWGADNVLPIDGGPGDETFHLAISMVDSLDTLWLMGMKHEFTKAKTWLSQNMKARIEALDDSTNVFEITIRALGGLLGAHTMSGDQVFLDLAQQLAVVLQSATDDEGRTPYRLDGSHGQGCPSIVESGSQQVEMRYLSQASGNQSFEKRSFKFYDSVQKAKAFHGLWPSCYEQERGTITLGANGDSFYEYLLKTWLQGGQKEDYLWKMYNDALDGLTEHMTKVSKSGFTYLVDLNWYGGEKIQTVNHFQHLACFVPGWIALGAPYQQDASRKKRHMKLADELATTCWQMYDAQPSKIGPEVVDDMRMDLSTTRSREYILRPEAMESWWYLYQRTGDQKYREWGWKTFLAYEKQLKVAHGYASLSDVRSPGKPSLVDREESFFFAETLKYAYLLQEPSNKVPLDKYVMNTEAHPLRILAGQ